MVAVDPLIHLQPSFEEPVGLLVFVGWDVRPIEPPYLEPKPMAEVADVGEHFFETAERLDTDVTDHDDVRIGSGFEHGQCSCGTRWKEMAHLLCDFGPFRIAALDRGDRSFEAGFVEEGALGKMTPTE